MNAGIASVPQTPGRAGLRASVEHTLTHLLAEAPSLSSIGPTLLEILCGTLGYEAGGLWISDAEAKPIRCAAWWQASAGTELERSTHARGATPLTAADLTQAKRSLRAEAALLAGLSRVVCYLIPGRAGGWGVAELLGNGPSPSPAAGEDDEMMAAVSAQVGQLVERCRLERELRQRTGEHQAILDSASYAVISTDTHGAIRTFNPAAEQLLGYRADTLIGCESPVRFHDPGELEAHAQRLSSELGRDVDAGFEALAGRAGAGTADENEWTLVGRDGRRFPALVAVTSLHDDHGDLSGYLLVAHDLSRQKEVDRLKDEFVSTVSHELRTPLTAIRGALGLLEGGVVGALTTEGLDMVRIARVNSDRLIRLINDLLDLDKIEAGRLELRVEDVEPARIVDTTLAEMHAVARKAGVRLLARKCPQGHVLADPDRLTQVLTNLVANGVKFAPRGGTVEVQVEPGRVGMLRFSVSDNGIGIPPDSMDKLFSKFVQLDGSDARNRSGTGLGLAISKAIIDEHLGEIGAESTVGVGSTFWFEVPIHIGNSAKSATALILLVGEDGRWSRAAAGRLAAEGHRIVRATTAGQMDRLMAEEAPTVVVVDVDSLRIAWSDLLGSKWERPGRRPPVLLVTGDGRPHGAGERDPTGVEWLQKSEGEAVLLRRLAPHLSRVSPRVLVVDADASLRMVLASQLRSLGLACTEAADGAEATERARTSRPDLIILDVATPGLNGYQVVEAMRRLGLHETPILIYSARELDWVERAALTLGRARFLTKGLVSVTELLAAVTELVQGGPIEGRP